MDNEIKFTCSNEAIPKVTKMIKQLALIGNEGTSRVIRIGGDETTFDGTVEKVADDISVNGVLDTTPYIPNTRRHNRRNSGVIIPQQTAIPTPQTAPTVPTTQSSDPLVVAVTVEVNRLIANNEMFTAWDVTKTLRNSMTIGRHSDAKNIVHSIYANGDMTSYRRELIDIDGVSERPYLYLPTTNNVDDYFTQKGLNRRVDANSSDVLTS
jgi:hypothetical protein